MRNRILLIVIMSQFAWLHAAAQMNGQWGDQGDGTYRNPVLPADFSDLDAIRVGDDFYAISSTMQFSPGMAVLHSRDLVNWTIIGHVVDDLTRISSNLNWNKMNCYGKGIWAGSIRYYKNRFWVYFGTPDDGFFMSSAENPAGPWEPLHPLWNVKGWDDCCSFCDDDNQLYFIATHFEPDAKNNKRYNIHLFKMTADGKSLIMGSDSIIYQAKGSEANKLYKINGRYYHYFSEVKEEGRVIMMQRAANIYGPWEVRQLDHVNKEKDREPNQGGLIRLQNGAWWFFTHHGAGDWEGRPASLLPVSWLDGWPVIGQPGADSIGNMVWDGKKPIQLSNEKSPTQFPDEFDSTHLLPQWEWNYQPRAEKWSLQERKGFLRLHAFTPVNPADKRKLWMRAGNTLTQRSWRTSSNTVTTRIDVAHMADGQQAGLTHFSTTSYSVIGVRQQQGSRSLFYSQNEQDTTGPRISGRYIWLRSYWDLNGINQYSFSVNGRSFIAFGKKSQLTWGSYRGDRVGLINFNTIRDAGYIDVDHFNYRYSK